MKNHFYLLSRLQKALSSGSKTLVIKKSTNHSPLLTELANCGLIKSFKQNDHLVSISLSHCSPFSNLSFNKLRRSISAKDLTKGLIRAGGNSNIVLQTNHGILAGTAAVKQNVGGKVLAKFY